MAAPKQAGAPGSGKSRALAENEPESPPVPPLNPDQERWFVAEVAPHEAALRNWLRVRFPSISDRDDLVQESFLRVWRARTRGPIASIKAFLFATARNLACDTLKQRFPQVDLGESGVSTVLDEHANTAETVARAQELEMLHDALQSLPERCRQVFTLRRLYGLTQRQIAAQLGISEKTVEAQNTIAMHKCVRFFEQAAARSTRASITPFPGVLDPVASTPQHA
jgi:RNA polymerase sigma factor (sigma-70 family)